MKLRKTYLDLMRIIAILCVIYNHTGERGYNLYVFNDSGVKHVFYVGIAAFVAVAVPIFFMISGALLLPKEESLSDLFRRRICRIITVIVLFSILQYFILMLEFGEKPSISFLSNDCLRKVS